MANPLTLLMPIIPGTSPLAIGAALAKYNAEINSALTSIGTVHYARFLLLDRSVPNLQPNLAPGAPASNELVLAVITEYDGSFQAYIGDFVAQIGDVFNALLQFVVGGAAVTPVQSNVAAFSAFVSANDASEHQPNEGLYSAYPQTVQQIIAAFDV
ncbi:hypothetical protein [Longimicrobium sp.]|uniref:hypothetical protein n=1 Tax=Longimicrobium sp. TaxID=2029185 RepID=UPI003B3A7A58